MKLAVKASRYSYQDTKTTQLLRQSVSAVVYNARLTLGSGRQDTQQELTQQSSLKHVCVIGTKQDATLPVEISLGLV